MKYLDDVVWQIGFLLSHFVKQLLEVAVHHLEKQIDPAFMFLFTTIIICGIRLKYIQQTKNQTGKGY